MAHCGHFAFDGRGLDVSGGGNIPIPHGIGLFHTQDVGSLQLGSLEFELPDCAKSLLPHVGQLTERKRECEKELNGERGKGKKKKKERKTKKNVKGKKKKKKKRRRRKDEEEKDEEKGEKTKKRKEERKEKEKERNNEEEKVEKRKR